MSYDNLPEWKRNKINKFAQKRDQFEEGTKDYNRLSNKINRWAGEGGWAWSDNYRDHRGGEGTDFQQSLAANDPNNPDSFMNVEGFPSMDTSNFDVNNKQDVIALQKQLFPNNPEEWDGMFGPKTEGAYRQNVNANRQISGEDQYQYDNASDPNINNAKQIGINAANSAKDHVMNSGNTISTDGGGDGGSSGSGVGKRILDFGSSMLNNLKNFDYNPFD